MKLTTNGAVCGHERVGHLSARNNVGGNGPGIALHGAAKVEDNGCLGVAIMDKKNANVAALNTNEGCHAGCEAFKNNRKGNGRTMENAGIAKGVDASTVVSQKSKRFRKTRSRDRAMDADGLVRHGSQVGDKMGARAREQGRLREKCLDGFVSMNFDFPPTTFGMVRTVGRNGRHGFSISQGDVFFSDDEHVPT